jgi:hypothetical protein
MAKPGDLAWAGSSRTIWLVHTMTEGTVIRESTWDKDRHEAAQYKTGKRMHINAHGLVPCSEYVELTDAEHALVAKEALLNA